MKLAQRGEDVVIIEKKEQIGGKACSGLVSERIWDHIPENESIVENRIGEVVLHFQRRSVSAVFRPGMLAMGRPTLDSYLSKLAQEAGANLLLENSFEGLQENGNKVLVKYNGEEEKFDRVIGCDGAVSRVRNHFEHKEPRYRAGIQCFEPKADNGSKAEAWPTRNGFFWKIPRGSHVEWGVFERKELAGKMWKDFAEERSLSGLNTQSAIIPEGVCVTNSDKVALCGDAAGLTKPWSGGGYSLGHNFGKSAARSVAQYSKL